MASPVSYWHVWRLILKSKFAYESFMVYVVGYTPGRKIQSDTKYVHVRWHHLPIWVSAALLKYSEVLARSLRVSGQAADCYAETPKKRLGLKLKKASSPFLLSLAVHSGHIGASAPGCLGHEHKEGQWWVRPHLPLRQEAWEVPPLLPQTAAKITPSLLRSILPT